MLLAVDLGLKAGLACYSREGRLLWARSTRFGTITRMKKALPSLVSREVSVVVTEGDTQLALHWRKVAEHRGAKFISVSPEVWRGELLLARNRRSGAAAKKTAEALAWSLFDAAGLSRPATLGHDAAEAILIGLWAVLDLEWLAAPPTEFGQS